MYRTSEGEVFLRKNIPFQHFGDSELIPMVHFLTSGSFSDSRLESRRTTAKQDSGSASHCFGYRSIGKNIPINQGCNYEIGER